MSKLCNSVSFGNTPSNELRKRLSDFSRTSETMSSQKLALPFIASGAISCPVFSESPPDENNFRFFNQSPYKNPSAFCAPTALAAGACLTASPATSPSALSAITSTSAAPTAMRPRRIAPMRHCAKPPKNRRKSMRAKVRRESPSILGRIFTNL